MFLPETPVSGAQKIRSHNINSWSKACFSWFLSVGLQVCGTVSPIFIYIYYIRIILYGATCDHVEIGGTFLLWNTPMVLLNWHLHSDPRPHCV